MIYLLIFGFSFLAFLRYINSTSKQDGQVVYVFIWLALILLAGLRYRVGGDSLHYFDIFDSYPTLLTLGSYDFVNAEYNAGWIIFNAIIKTFSDSFYTFQIFHAIIVNSIIFYFIQRYSRNKFLVIFFYLFFYYLYFNMEVLRESLAIAVFLLAIPSLLSKSWLKYYSYCLLAYFFHSSALILIIFPLFAKKMQVKYQVMLLVLLTLAINFISFDSLIGSLFGSFSFGQRATRSYLVKEMNIFGVLIILIKIMGFYFIYVIAQRKKVCFDHPFIIFITPYIIIGVLASVIPGVYRFLNYLAIPILIYVVDVLYSFIRIKSNSSASLAKVFSCFLILILLQTQYFTRDTSKYTRGKSSFYNIYIPYHSMFDEKVDQTREDIFYNQWK
ncbi:EpsG family protein [Sphingobacterium multivorum]|uniref:EpsG family protein n=1 Tax=Sphingobacterium multivorum TaxID=28454 RepID=UPI0031BAEAEF